MSKIWCLKEHISLLILLLCYPDKKLVQKMNRPVQNLDQQNFHTPKFFRFIFNKLSPHSNFDGSKSELTGSNTELCFCRGWKNPSTFHCNEAEIFTQITHR